MDLVPYKYEVIPTAKLVLDKNPNFSLCVSDVVCVSGGAGREEVTVTNKLTGRPWI